jgi:hypothetical protein
MSVSRRQVLGGAAVLGVACTMGVHHMAKQGSKTPLLIVYDSRKPASLAFARTQASKRGLDIAHAASWTDIRTAGRKAPIAGLTSWNDYVFARQWLEERGLRVQVEKRDRSHDLIEWMMA